MGGLIGTADMVKSGLMDKYIISKLITKSSGVNQQIAIIKSTGINPYYTGLVSVYRGGINYLYSIATSGENSCVKSLTNNVNSEYIGFYLNTNKDLIIKVSQSTTTFRVRLLLLDSANIDFTGCMVDNLDIDLQKVDIK